MTKTLPPDPEGMNDDRAAWAATALRQFRRVTGSEHENALGDLLCDLMHWSDRHNFDFEAALDRARGHYAEETAPCESADLQDDMLEALELCEDALSELARLDDGTPSVAALHRARSVIARAKGGAA